MTIKNLSQIDNNGNDLLNAVIDANNGIIFGNIPFSALNSGAVNDDLSISAENNKIPTALAVQLYVQSINAGISFYKQPVVAASTANVNISTGLVNGATLDGVTLSTGDRVLLKNQTDASENGIYIVASSGAASRSTDMDEDTEAWEGVGIYVRNGTVGQGDTYRLQYTGVVDVGVTDLDFVQFGKAADFNVGLGLTKTGDDQIAIDTNEVLRWKKVSVSTGDFTSNQMTILAATHGLGAKNSLNVQVYETGSPNIQVNAGVEVYDNGNVRITATGGINGYVMISG